MGKITHLFIDFDDTLYDTYGNSSVALAETFDHFHLGMYCSNPQEFYDNYWAANIDLWGRYSKGEITRSFLIVERFRRPVSKLSSLPCSEEDIDSYCLNMNSVFLDFCSSKSGVVDGAHELLSYLQSRGYSLHMCSNGFHEVQYKKLAACGLGSFFKSVILSEDAGANKPSKAYFDYALAHSGALPETTVMIGDNLQTDIVGAHNAGLTTILFNRWNVEPTAEADHTVTHLREIMNIL